MLPGDAPAPTLRRELEGLGPRSVAVGKQSEHDSVSKYWQHRDIQGVAVDSAKAPAPRPDQQDGPGWDEGGWRTQAACRGEDPELFFPIGTTGPVLEQIAEAKEVCARCPVRDACLDFALSTGQAYGIWGGLTEDERRSLRRRRQRAAARQSAAGQPRDRVAG
jgi:WhiB family transcriptional regulator, redox-sensing transcriptional regulator